MPAMYIDAGKVLCWQNQLLAGVKRERDRDGLGRPYGKSGPLRCALTGSSSA
jgi:hypothetical protein